MAAKKIAVSISDEDGIVADEGPISDKLLRILDSGGGDIIVMARTGSVRAFSEIWCATSEPLKNMLSDKFCEQKEKTISFETYGFEAVKFFVEYIHGDKKKCPWTYDDTFDLIELCEMYGLKNYVSFLIKKIIEWATEENGIKILCLCDSYLRVSLGSKIKIKNHVKKILFEDSKLMMKKYFEFKDTSEIKEPSDFNNITNEHCVSMSEKIIKEYISLSVSVSLVQYSELQSERCELRPERLTTDGEIFKMYPQIKKIFTWSNGNHYIRRKQISELKSTDEYIITKKTYNELEFIFL